MMIQSWGIKSSRLSRFNRICNNTSTYHTSPGRMLFKIACILYIIMGKYYDHSTSMLGSNHPRPLQDINLNTSLTCVWQKPQSYLVSFNVGPGFGFISRNWFSKSTHKYSSIYLCDGAKAFRCRMLSDINNIFLTSSSSTEVVMCEIPALSHFRARTILHQEECCLKLHVYST
jgi:hypothetical protein